MPVITVLGEVDESELGLVLPHEHLMIDFANLWEPPEDPAELRDAFRALTPELVETTRQRPVHYFEVLGLGAPRVVIEELEAFTSVGGRSVVELTNWSIARKPQVLAAISRLTGLHIVMGSGEYREPAHSPFVRFASVEQLRDMMIADVAEGSNGIRAGILGEIGTSNPMTEAEAKVLHAAAQAAVATGVSVNVHRTRRPDEMAGLAGLDLLLNDGVPPERIVISHCDHRAGAGFALEVGRRGAYISCDTFGMRAWSDGFNVGEPMPTDEERIQIVEEVISAGYLDQLLLSHDVCMQTQLTRYGGFGYGHLDRNIIPLLRARGLGDEEFERIRVKNPARSLTLSEARR
jgi:phosphotriesterase-related protein